MKTKDIIDLHTHGIGRYDTRTKNPEDILKIAELHGKTGTSAILPTIYSSTIQQMRTNMEAVRKAIRIQDTGYKMQVEATLREDSLRDTRYRIQDKEYHNASCIVHRESRILGVHLEGPFLNPVRCGAQNKNSFIKPSITSLKKLIDGYEDIVRILTIAPELPGALKVIEQCVSLGIKVNMGHSDATYRQALDGKNAGARGISHIFNAMRPFHHGEPGLIGMGLLDKDIYTEVIADNIHINKITLELIFKVKQPDKIILVSDSVKDAGNKKAKAGVLAGSSITLADAVRNLKDFGIQEKTAIKAATDNPKKYLL